ncbi:MAG: ParB/RepB/Spo0J family partition protein, partial [Oscillospiraceae bacterium]
MNKILGNNFNQNKRVSRKLCLSNSEKENFSQPSTFEKKKLAYISIFDIYPNENQPRKIFNTVKLNALAESIKSLGLLQPITVEQKDKTGKYRIIAGERRYRAAKMANLSELPCIVLKNTDIKNSLISLTENVQRENLNIFEEADALKNILKNSNYTQESLAKELGKAQCTIANKLRL